MRDLERLLTGAYPEGLRDVPPAPVRKSAVRDKTFEKLGLERPERQPLPHEQWSQAEPVVKRRRPWAMVAACLAVVTLVGAALWALPLAAAPGQGQSGPLPAGTYLECSVTEAAFDEESWSMVLTAEATTDLDLDNPSAATGYGISANVAMTTDYSRISFGGLDPDTLTRWTETGENTYRCEGILVEVDPEFQMVNVLIGQLDLNLELYVGFGEQNTAGLWEDFLLADAPFTLELPMPEGSRLDFVRPNPPATYFTCQAVEAAFSQEQQALVFTLEAQTDMDLDNADCQSLYSFLYTLTFQGENGAYQYPSYDGATVDALAHWTQTGEDTYRCEGFTVPVDLALLAEQGIAGTAAGTLDLVVTDTSYVGAEDPWQFFPSVEFAVELEETSAPVSFESAQEEVYYKMLNSMDYFTTARVSFTEVLPGFDEELAYTIETNLDTSIAHQTLTSSDDPDFSQETYADGTTVWEYDNQAKRFSSAGEVEKRRTLAEEWPGITERYSIDENGDPHYRYRGNPTNVSGAEECLLPQTWAFGLLPEKDLWVIEGSLEYCGRTCYDIVGTVGDSYAAQIGAGQFRMYVDQETGILLMLDAWNDQGSACSVTVTEITVDDPSICAAFNYDMSPYQDYTQGTGPSLGVIGSEDGPTVVYSTP